MFTHPFFKPQVSAIWAALLLATAAPAWADNTAQFEQAMAAYNAGNYKQAFHLLQPLAQQGDAEAQFNLGVMYSKGQGVAQSYQRALAWYQKAAHQGLAAAQYNLSKMYEDGRGVAQDYQQALAWYQKAANQGYSDAQFNLGVMYDEGRGVAQDYQQALAWYQKAANQGDAMAQYNLGVMYYEGRGVAQNYQQALSWYQKAANQGVAGAQYNLGFIYATGQGVAQDFQQGEQVVTKGYDHSFIVNKAWQKPCVLLTSPNEDLSLEVLTSQAALQVYTGNYLAGTPTREGGNYQDFSGIALETQCLPDTPNHPEWQNYGGIQKAGKRYYQWTEFRFKLNS